MLKKTASSTVVASPNAAKKSVAKKAGAPVTTKAKPTGAKPTTRKTPATRASAKQVVAKKMVTKKVATKPVVKKAAVKKTPMTKTPSKPLVKTAVKRDSNVAAKPSVKTAVKKPLVPVVGTPKGKIKKSKLVRDSFTMPESEYQILNDVKKAFLKSGVAVKKSELLRAGVALLNTTSEDKLRILIAGLPALKAGRPKKDK